MRTVNVSNIIESRGLDFKEVANQLFPTNKYPELALNRVIQGKGNLDSDQLSKLALLADMQIADLFSGEQWKSSGRSGLHVFTNGEFRAELDSNTWVTKLFHNNSVFHESIIHSGATQLSDYLSQLDIIINNYKNKQL